MSAAIPPSQFPPLPWKAKIDSPTHKALLALGLIEEALGDLDGRDTPEYVDPDRVLNAYKALVLAMNLLRDATAAGTEDKLR
jgi:hypothetical protein